MIINILLTLSLAVYDIHTCTLLTVPVTVALNPNLALYMCIIWSEAIKCVPCWWFLCIISCEYLHKVTVCPPRGKYIGTIVAFICSWYYMCVMCEHMHMCVLLDQLFKSKSWFGSCDRYMNREITTKLLVWFSSALTKYTSSTCPTQWSVCSLM